MFTIDQQSRDFFKDKVGEDKMLRIFFGGYG